MLYPAELRGRGLKTGGRISTRNFRGRQSGRDLYQLSLILCGAGEEVAGAGVGGGLAGPGERAVDQDMFDAGRGPDRVFESGGIEQDKIGEKAFAYQAAILQPEGCRRQAGHFVDRLFRAQDAFLADIPAEHPWEGAPQARWGLGWPGRPSDPIIAAGKAMIRFSSSSSIWLVHLEMDRAGGVKLFGRVHSG